jgi:serine/threonine-protein kinase
MIKIGEKLGDFLIKAEIGQGGMGTIYFAIDTMLNREVALKVIHPSLADNQQLMERFKIEAMTQARLNHPNIVTIFSFSRIADQYVIAMEYVEGKSLKDVLHEKRQIHPAEAVGIIAQVAEGLRYAHTYNVIHRDIKPANILINRDGKVKISDFGIAKILGAQGLTKTGMLVGTPWYTSPEQIVGKGIDFRSDLYSLGVTFYEVLTGRVPFDSETNSEFQIQKAHLETPPPRPSIYNPEIGVKLEKFILTALQKKPEKRFQSARDMIEGLQDLHSGLTKAGAAAPMAFTRKAEPPVLRKPRPRLTPLKVLAFLILLLSGVILFVLLTGNGGRDDMAGGTSGASLSGLAGSQARDDAGGVPAGGTEGSLTATSTVPHQGGDLVPAGDGAGAATEPAGAGAADPGAATQAQTGTMNVKNGEAQTEAKPQNPPPAKEKPDEALVAKKEPPSGEVELGSLDDDLARLRGFLEGRNLAAADRLVDALVRSGAESRAFPVLGKVKFLLNQFAAAERLWTRALQDNLLISLEMVHLHGGPDDFCLGQIKFKKKLILFNSNTRGDHSLALTAATIRRISLGRDMKILLEGEIGGQAVSEEFMVAGRIGRMPKEKFLVDFLNHYVL